MLGYSFLEFAKFAESSTNINRQYVPTVEQIHTKVIPGLEGRWITFGNRCVICCSRLKPLHVREYMPTPTCLDCILWPKYCHNTLLKSLIFEFKETVPIQRLTLILKIHRFRNTIKRNKNEDLSGDIYRDVKKQISPRH